MRAKCSNIRLWVLLLGFREMEYQIWLRKEAVHIRKTDQKPMLQRRKEAFHLRLNGLPMTRILAIF